MPDLGKAVYTLVLNTAPYNKGLAAAEARAVAATKTIDANMNRTAVATKKVGAAATGAAAEVSTAAATTAAATGKAAAAAEASSARTIASFMRIRKAGDAMAAEGAKWTRTFSGLAIGLGFSAKASLNFENSLTDIRALVGATDEQVEQYREAILKLAREGPIGPKKLADALYFIVSSGFQGQSALDALTASARASAAGLGETRTVADAVTSAVNAYGEEALSASRATDILLAAVREGKNEPEELAGAIGRVIAPAQAMGVEFEEVAGALASLSLVGLDAAEGTTAVRGALLGLLKPTQETRRFLKGAGEDVASLRTELAERGLIPTLTRLAQKFEGNQDAIGNLFPNVRALNGFLALTGENAAKVDKVMRGVADSVGDTDVAFGRAMTDNMNKLRKAWSSLQVVMIQVGDNVVPIVVKLAGALAKAAEAFSKLPADVRKVVTVFALMLVTVGPVMFVYGKLLTAVGLLIGPFLKLRAAMLGTQVATAAVGTAAGTAGLSILGLTGIILGLSSALALALVKLPLVGGALDTISDKVAGLAARMAGVGSEDPTGRTTPEGFLTPYGREQVRAMSRRARRLRARRGMGPGQAAFRGGQWIDPVTREPLTGEQQRSAQEAWDRAHPQVKSPFGSFTPTIAPTEGAVVNVPRRSVVEHPGAKPARTMRKIEEKAKRRVHGPMIPLELQVAEVRAERQGPAALERVLKREQAHLDRLLAWAQRKKLGLDKILAIEREISRVDSQLDQIHQEREQKEKEREQRQLDRFKRIQETIEREARANMEIIKEEKRRQREAKLARRESAQAARELRGSFFGEFAPNIFHQTPQGLALGAAPGEPGSGRGAVKYEQHNTYNEIPRDKHSEARRMRRAAEASLGGV